MALPWCVQGASPLPLAAFCCVFLRDALQPHSRMLGLRKHHCYKPCMCSRCAHIGQPCCGRLALVSSGVHPHWVAWGASTERCMWQVGQHSEWRDLSDT
jgi:hypothetical protein